MKPILTTAILLAAPAAALAPPGQSLEFRVASETRLTKSFQHTLRLRLASMGMSLGGEQVPASMLRDFSIDVEQHLRARVVDEYPEVDGDGPLRIRRTFEALAHTGRRSAQTGAGPESSDHASKSPFEGRTVVFAREGGAWDAAFADGGPSDPALLDGLDVELDFSAFLPAGEVRPGDGWELDAKLFHQVVSPGGELAFETPDGPPGGEGEAIGRALEHNLAGELRATYAGVRRLPGAEVAVIELACDLWTEGEELASDPQGDPLHMSMAVSFDLTGELLWDLEAGHFHTLELRGELGLVMAITGSLRGEDGEPVTMRQTLDFDGDLDLYAEVVGEQAPQPPQRTDGTARAR